MKNSKVLLMKKSKTVKQPNNLLRIFGAVFLFCAIPVVTLAAGKVGLEVGLGTKTEVSDITDYIITLYNFIISIIGVLSAVMIMYAGLLWAAANGNSEKIGNAKERMVNAIVGLVIALTSYVVLNTINPALVNFKTIVVSAPNVPQTPVPQVVSQGTVVLTGDNKCDAAPALIDFMKPGVIPESYKPYLKVNDSAHCADQNMVNALLGALGQLANPSSPYYGMKLNINSSWRTPYTPGTGSYHNRGQAIDVTWSPINGTKPYVSLAGRAGEAHGLDFNNKCVCNKADDAKCTEEWRGTDKCTPEDLQSVEALNQMMSNGGFAHICVEWWHHQVERAQTCGVGHHTYRQL